MESHPRDSEKARIPKEKQEKDIENYFNFTTCIPNVNTYV